MRPFKKLTAYDESLQTTVSDSTMPETKTERTCGNCKHVRTAHDGPVRMWLFCDITGLSKAADETCDSFTKGEPMKNEDRYSLLITRKDGATFTITLS